MGFKDLFSKGNQSTDQAKPMAERVDASLNSEQDFDDDAFWRKIARVLKNKGKKAVGDVLVMALKLYYVMLDDDTPRWAKLVIYGALVYFVVPMDMLPDILPTGYIDDAGTLSAAIGTVHSHIKQEHHDNAQNKVDTWFGDDSTLKSATDDSDIVSEQ